MPVPLAKLLFEGIHIQSYILIKSFEFIINLLVYLVILSVLSKKAESKIKSFSIVSFLFGIFWLIYKKMWKAFFLSLLLMILILTITVYFDGIESVLRENINKSAFKQVWNIDAILGQLTFILTPLYFGFSFPLISIIYSKSKNA